MHFSELTLVLYGSIAFLIISVLFLIWKNQTYRKQYHHQASKSLLLNQQLSQSAEFNKFKINQLEDEVVNLKAKNENLANKNNELSQDSALAAELKIQRESLSKEYNVAQAKIASLGAELESTKAKAELVEKSFEEKLSLMENAEKRLQEQFENLANRIFEKKSESFSKLNKSGLDTLLSPLKEQIEGFKKQVTDQYVKEGQERASLKTEILGLKELNKQITSEAAALTQALKGDNKQQGNWGEVVLERILKESGLREGHEFETQVSARSDSGKLLQPDIVIHLPNDKDVIIDAKVSLSAYERFFNADDTADKGAHLKEHVNSIRAHIKGLSKKEYHDIKSLRSLDYVLMFIPIEPAFLLAIEEEPELVNMALNANIMIVSPTNLLVALRTINNIWQYEYQNQNAQEIANRAAKLYDKFYGFINDMEKIDRALDTTRKSFDGAFNKLTKGRGNIVRQIEQFRELGVQPNNRIPDSIVGLDGVDE